MAPDPWEVGEATAASQPSVISFPRAVPNVVAQEGQNQIVVHSVRSLMWSWDEAGQKLKRFRQRNSGRKENKGNMSQQTMVQSGSAGNFTKSMGSDEICMDRDKIIVRTLRLESTKTEYLLDGIQRSVPGGLGV